ncbi:MAG TPA: asparagine synthase (glutamine-hydrolyzing) [Vicinamibacterales bacterium]|nr:asparagine synthase (glutamine-hydrolyzing) [Vicinamibacterales bacterium]
MCGIAGILRREGAPVFETEVRSMCDLMTHRGPDDDGVYIGDGVGLGMRRLSIIGLSNGSQPIANEDRTVWVVFNGEIYNYEALRSHLAARGHMFRTDSDTECLVHLYEDYGVEFVEHLRGMFAFAIWDTGTRQLLLGRDRLGIKPLYYAETGDGLYFASEIKPILQFPAIQRTLDWGAVGHLLTFLATPSSASIVAGISKLEPAHVAVASDRERLTPKRYWSVSFNADTRSTEAQLVDQLRALLEESVALHRVSDVPIGAFLSGGVDSSAVVATLARQHPDRIKTFSIGFEESNFDELGYARQVAARYGTDHHELVVRPDVVRIVEDLTWYLDEPFGDTSAIPTYMVSGLASGHVKVVLTGDGGDEVFAGYDRYAVEDRERVYDRLPRPLRRIAGGIGDALPDGATGKRFLQHLALDGPRRYLDASMLFRSSELERLLRPDAYREVARHDFCAPAFRTLQARGGDWLGALQHFDLNAYLPQDILTKVDRMTMAHSVEARPPLLDHRLVEFAATIPAHLRLRNGTTKYLFKKAVRGLLPDTIIDRPKQGFAVPLARWLRKDLAVFARDVLLSDSAKQRGIFNLSYVEHLLALHDRGRDLDLQLWTILSLELWCRRFIDGDVSAMQAQRPRPNRQPVAELA